MSDLFTRKARLEIAIAQLESLSAGLEARVERCPCCRRQNYEDKDQWQASKTIEAVLPKLRKMLAQEWVKTQKEEP